MLYNFITLIWFHFVADFVFQTDNMAINKSKSLKWLGIHATTYALPFFYFGLSFMTITGLSHFIVDFFSSRITSYFWRNEKRHWFFVTIGADQAIHITILLLTYTLLFV